jgi:thymidylate synthase, flavin-dependent
MTQITTTLIDHMGSDLSVVNAARVSFGKKSEWEHKTITDTRYEVGSGGETVSIPFTTVRSLSDRDTKLIKYLAKHRHLSPFGHAFASFHVKAPIFVARQLVKHKFLRWNEVSRRYVDDDPEFYVPEVWRGKSADKKQGSNGVVNLDTWVVDRTYEGDFGKYEGELYDVDSYNDLALDMYKGLIGQQVSPEMARMVLPQSTMTEWYWSGSLDAFASMCRLRCASDTQYESRIVADQISDVMRDLFPVSWDALIQTGEE